MSIDSVEVRLRKLSSFSLASFSATRAWINSFFSLSASNARLRDSSIMRAVSSSASCVLRSRYIFSSSVLRALMRIRFISCSTSCALCDSSIASSSARRFFSASSSAASSLRRRASLAARISSCSCMSRCSMAARSRSAVSRSCFSRVSLFRSTCLRCFSSLACAFICCISIVSGLRRFMYRSWFPTHRSSISLFMRSFSE
uniref:Uncharacterized protein n=1 Tax=Anopheles darlingi TaxID=43151 RepID=A0A2M4CVV3_ANODA